MEKIVVYDTTLRDGTQGEGISLSVQDKINIAKKLDSLGVDFIEGGWPGSNPKDMDFFKEVQGVSFNHAKITAFGSTRRAGIEAKDDVNLNAFVASGVSYVTIFGKSWDFHVKSALKVSLEENLDMIKSSILYLKSKGIKVFYDAEHFFDGLKNNRDYALLTVKTAAEAGAEALILCDTNGGTLPDEIKDGVVAVIEHTGLDVGIHAHNDSDLAVANSILAVQAGACHVQGTMNGLGERCGNANLCSIIPNLQLKMGYDCLAGDGLKHLTEAARFVSETANLALGNNQAFVGHSAFAHKAGIHVNAVLKDPRTYEHIDPSTVGNVRRVLVSELSGASNLQYKIKELGLDFPDDKNAQQVFIKKIKELEYQGYQFEGAEGSFELLLKKESGVFDSGFRLESFHVSANKRGGQPVVSEASIKISVGEDSYHTAADGNGPVDALDNAIRKALETFYPKLKEMHLVDYKVRVLDGKDATSAKVRVLIESTDGDSSWTTIGVSTDIIEASWYALTDSISYKLMKDAGTKV
ncbi:MAG: citramalate synthase [Firmicutes bacterium]|nr:citramalate synthase [Bacillota bacterium]